MNFFFKSLLAAVLLLCSTVATAHNFEVGGIFYNITSSTEKTVEVTYKGYYYDSYSNEYTGDVTVPSSVEYNGETYSVTSIGYRAFQYCSGLTSIEIPASVTSIGQSAFNDCSGLTSIEIPGNVTSIGINAFNDCSGLKSIELPGSVTRIGDWAFSGCFGLTSIVVAEENTIYDSRNNCNAIIETATNTLIQGCKNTIIPYSVTSIGEMAFHDCSGLTSIEIPGSVTSIGDWAFSSCSGLTSIEIPGSVTSIGNDAFQHCSGLTSIEIPGSVTSIGNDAFWRCYGLKSVTIGDGVTSIEDWAFCDCSGLTSVTSLATTAPALGSDVFSYISSGATLYYPAGSDYSSWAQYFANIEEITEEEEVFGDLNGDGTVSVSDIQVLVNIILGN